jgi:hypothetical protein
MEREAKRAAKIEQKVGILVNGLQQRDARLREQADNTWAALQMELVNLECFRVRAKEHREDIVTQQRSEGTQGRRRHAGKERTKNLGMMQWSHLSMDRQGWYSWV